MSFSYWVYHPATRLIAWGLVVAVILAAGYEFVTRFWPDSPPSHEQQAIVSEEAYLAANLDADCRELLASPPAVETNPKQTDDCKDKAVAQKHNHASLVQSIRSANAAMYSAYIVYLQTCIGIIGAILVIATLSASVVATWAARNAAKGTVDAARATRQLLNFSRREFHLLHRPILRVRKVKVDPGYDDKPIYVRIEVANVGDNRASLDVILAEIEIRDEATKQFKASGTAATQLPIYLISNGASVEISFPTSLKWEPSFMLRTEMIITGTLRYRDSYAGPAIDLALGTADFKPTMRSTGFQRFLVEQMRDGSFRFTRHKEPDPEHEYED